MKSSTLLLALTMCLLSLSNCSDDNNKEDTLTLSAKDVSFTSFGEKQNLSITSNTKWKVEKKSSDTWYTVSPLSGEGDAEISIEVGENTDSKGLESTFYIKTNNKTESIIIK